MAEYMYRAISKSGKEIKGKIESESVEKAKADLKARDLVLTEISEASLLQKDLDINIGGRVKVRDLCLFCRQFVSMQRAGVTIIETLKMLSEATTNKTLSKALKNVCKNVEKGESLADSLEMEEVFPKLLINMTQAGEASGSLDVAYERMALQFEKEAKLKGLIKKASIYPIIVCVVAIVVVIVMLTFVVPSFMGMFEDMDIEMPALTMAVVHASEFMQQRWYVVLPVIVAIVVFFKWFKSTERGEGILAKIALKIPLFGDMTIKSASANLARTLSTMMAAGIPLVEGVEITAGTMTNYYFKHALLDAKESIIAGVPLSVPLKECGLFPPMVYHMTRIGEESGNMEEMLSKLADYYEEEVEIATQSLMAALEPLIIIVLAGLVGTILGSVMMPMMTMYEGLDNL
ncbi:MAG: type II secretion system F family protein [Lachnospiraceae bacterium]|nr:type II secretion system F family protein [Lachnospiraceae bacterium]